MDFLLAIRHDGPQRAGGPPRPRVPIVLGVAILLIGACTGAGPPPTDETNFDADVETQAVAKGTVNTQEIDRGKYGDIVEGTQAVLRNEDELADFWAKLHEGQTGAHEDALPDPPPVDFDARMVVAIVLGERSTGGYSVDIDRVVADEDEGAMRVEFVETVPGDACAATQVLTSPYILVAVNVQDGPADANDEVLFSRSEQTGC